MANETIAQCQTTEQFIDNFANSAADRSDLESLLQRMKRLGFLHASDPSVDSRVTIVEDRLLQLIGANRFHVLKKFLLLNLPGVHGDITMSFL